MIRLFKHYVPHAVLLLGLVDIVLLMVTAEASWVLRAWQIGMTITPFTSRLGPILTFAVAVEISMVAVGVYGLEALQSVRFACVRLIVAVALGMIFISVFSFLCPGLTLWRSNALYAALIAPTLLTISRMLLGTALGSEAFKRRVMVLGAGPSTAMRSRAWAIMSSTSRRPRWCWRCRSAATRCPCRICCGSRPPASTSTSSRPSSSARPAESISPPRATAG